MRILLAAVVFAPSIGAAESPPYLLYNGQSKVAKVRVPLQLAGSTILGSIDDRDNFEAAQIGIQTSSDILGLQVFVTSVESGHQFISSSPTPCEATFYATASSNPQAYDFIQVVCKPNLGPNPTPAMLQNWIDFHRVEVAITSKANRLLNASEK